MLCRRELLSSNGKNSIEGDTKEKGNNRGCFYSQLEIFDWSSDYLVTIDDLFMTVLRLLVPSKETPAQIRVFLS